MTIAATSLAAALWDRDGQTDAIRQSSRKDAQQMLLMCKMDSKVFNRRFERNTVSANVCALTVD